MKTAELQHEADYEEYNELLLFSSTYEQEIAESIKKIKSLYSSYKFDFDADEFYKMINRAREMI